MVKNSTILILGALAAAAVFAVRRGYFSVPGTKQTMLTNVLSGTQVTLGNGNVYDTDTGIIFDPMTGNYTDILSGKIVYSGAA